MSLRSSNKERYDQWCPEDLVVMSIEEHRRLHMTIEQKTRRRTKLHNEHISQSLLEKSLDGYAVVISNDDERYAFWTCCAAADYIGCSKQLISQCLRPNTQNVRACGWTVEKVDADIARKEFHEILG